jgi:hypothetical protein
VHASHAVSADGRQCDRCLVVAREVSATLPCLYAKITGMGKSKRGYSNEFPIDQSRRIKKEIDWVPPSLDRSLRAKLKRDGLSLRLLTLRLWSEWLKS